MNNSKIPSETIIRFSKSKAYTATLSLIAGVCALFFYLSYPDIGVLLIFIIPVLLMVFLMGHSIYISYKIAQNRQPQIILNEQGIHTCNTIFYSWADIKNEAVVTDGMGKNPEYYLVYDHPAGSENLCINPFDIGPTELRQLLLVYRNRFENARDN